MIENRSTALLIKNILPAEEELLLKGVFLIILHANKIPPHLALSVGDKMYTLTTSGSTVDSNLQNLLKAIKQRGIQTIFIQLILPSLFTLDQVQNEIRKYVLAYPKVEENKATCLAPINDFCATLYNTDLQKINFLFDLLNSLFEKKAIMNCFEMNLKEQFSQQIFTLTKYTMFDVQEEIRKNQRLLQV